HESHIYGFELSDSMLEPKRKQQGQEELQEQHMMQGIGMQEQQEGVLLLRPSQPWEFKSGDYRWNEGPFMLKHKGVYYLMYSANFYRTRDYSVGYAVSNNPLGPLVKYEHNPVLFSPSEEISGPGHHSVTESP